VGVVADSESASATSRKISCARARWDMRRVMGSDAVVERERRLAEQRAAVKHLFLMETAYADAEITG
jgi:hypothetical protein